MKIPNFFKRMVNKKIKNVVFVGGGVATVFSVIKLLNEGVDGSNITIIEAGAPTKDRNPNDVMKGFLGAGGFSDGKILYSLKQGGYLDKYTGEKKANELMGQLKKLVRQFHPDHSKIVETGIAEEPEFVKDSPFELRQAPCEHLGTDFLYEIGVNIQKYFDDNNVNMMYHTEVVEVDFEGNGLTLRGKGADKIINEQPINNEGVTEVKIPYDELVIAVGKSGTTFTQKLIDKYKLETIAKSTQIGVRFESEYKYFKKLAKDFYDFKLYKKYSDDVSIRTFCTNNVAAYVAVEETFGNKSYNGHAYKDENKINNKTNFGIMMEIKNIPKPFEFTRALVKKCNTEGVGKCYSPGNKIPSVEAKKIGPQVFGLLYGNKYTGYILDFIKNLEEMFEFGDDYIIYIPEIKYLTNEIVLNKKDLSLPNYKNVHLAGDCAGARGIFVSGCHGIYIGEKLAHMLPLKKDK